jgi:hypothetical protein
VQKHDHNNASTTGFSLIACRAAEWSREQVSDETADGKALFAGIRQDVIDFRFLARIFAKRYPDEIQQAREKRNEKSRDVH